MTPQRVTNVDDRTIEEFYWGGRRVVYVDNRLVTTSYDQTRHDIYAGKEPAWVDPPNDIAPPVPCATCGRYDMPLHTNLQCPECQAESPEGIDTHPDMDK